MSEDSSIKNWSSGFQRLRAECVILVLIILAVTQLDVNLSKVPLIGLEISHPVSKGVLVSFLYGFFIFFLVSWWYRYVVELRDLQGTTLPITQMLSALGNWVHEIRSLEQPNAEIFKEHLRQVQKAFESGSEALETASARLKLDGSEIATLLQQYANPPEPQQPTQSDVIMARPSKASLNPLPNTVERLQEAITTGLSTGESILAKQRALFEQTTQFVANAQSTLDKELNDKGPRIAQIAEEFKLQADEIMNDLERSRRAITIDRKLLSFLIPFGCCIVALAYSLPQGVLDIHKSVKSFQVCEDCHFLFRRDGAFREMNIEGASQPRFVLQR